MVIWVIGRNYPLSDNDMQGSFELEQAKMLAWYGNEVHYLACSLHPLKRSKAEVSKLGLRMVFELQFYLLFLLPAFVQSILYRKGINSGASYLMKWRRKVVSQMSFIYIIQQCS